MHVLRIEKSSRKHINVTTSQYVLSIIHHNIGILAQFYLWSSVQV